MGIFRSIAFVYTGNKNFTKDGYARASKAFDNSALERKLNGKNCVVTGANAGIGYKTSEELARRGCTLYMVCRNQERGEAAVKKIIEATGNTDVHLKIADISSLSDVKRLAANFVDANVPIHVLVNNAGVLLNEKKTSAEGFELSFATNTLGTFALTLALEKSLKLAGQSRVIMVASGGMYQEGLETEDLQHEKLKKFDGVVAYSRDKRRQVAIAERLSTMWKDAGIFACSMHPGWTDTEGVQTSIPGFHKAFKEKLRDLYQGCDTIVWLALEDVEKLEGGGFYLDRKPQAKHLSFAGTHYSSADVDKLWNKLLAMASISP